MQLQAELDRGIEVHRKSLGWHVKEGFIEFEHGIGLEHRRLRMTVNRFLRQSPLLTILTAPVIYSMIIPVVILDAWTAFYQSVCFRAFEYSAFDALTILCSIAVTFVT